MQLLLVAMLSRLKANVKRTEDLEKENQKLKGNLSVLSADLTSKSRENKTLKEKLGEVEKENSKVSVFRRLVCINES